jgi:hypothetical protein
MVRLQLLAAGITAAFAIPLSAAVAENAALLKQAQEIFHPLPKDGADAESPTTRERVELGRVLFFDPRLTADGKYELFELSSTSVLRNRRITESDRRQATPASAQRSYRAQYSGIEDHTLAW